MSIPPGKPRLTNGGQCMNIWTRGEHLNEGNGGEHLNKGKSMWARGEASKRGGATRAMEPTRLV